METSFDRPADWPQGVLAQRLVVCPACTSTTDVDVRISTDVRVTEDGFEHDGSPILIAPDAPAMCGACCHRDDFDAFRAWPRTLRHSGPVWFEWETDQGCGSVRWSTMPASLIDSLLTTLEPYWPGISVTVEGGEDGITISTDPVWAGMSPALIDHVLTVLERTLGAPDTTA